MALLPTEKRTGFVPPEKRTKLHNLNRFLMPFAIVFDVMLVVMSLHTQVQRVSLIGKIIGWQGVVIVSAIGAGVLLYWVVTRFERYERLVYGKVFDSKEKFRFGEPDTQQDLLDVAVAIFLIVSGLAFFFW